jgi:hypothetical protein
LPVLKYRSGEVGLWNVIGTRTQSTSSQTAIGKNLRSETIHKAKKTAQALYALQLEDFRTRSLAIPFGTGFRPVGESMRTFLTEAEKRDKNRARGAAGAHLQPL